MSKERNYISPWVCRGKTYMFGSENQEVLARNHDSIDFTFWWMGKIIVGLKNDLKRFEKSLKFGT